MPSNRLDQETSPYLLQHKDNPVHWMPWSGEALERAKTEDKPILLSVGYAACHWCHVMAHESFENPAIADVMNSLFVNIKVDREERPDLDAIYQSAINMLGEQGGWPLTVFLTPEGVPFWGGTYFPPTARYGRPGFSSILEQISGVYQNERSKIEQNATALGAALRAFGTSDQNGSLSPEKIKTTSDAALDIVDYARGGTSGAPKFPQPTFFRFLWHAFLKGHNERARDAVMVTLENICQGGIYDHLGGGFSRYSVDEQWLAPHFEKMLYDNALLIELLVDVWRSEQTPLFAERIHETIDWLMRDLKTGIDDGTGESFALASAFDADSEGVEGKFYIWSAAEIDAALGADAPLFRSIYDISDDGNWENHTILNRRVGDAEATDPYAAVLANCRQTLLAIRANRIPPQRDDKVLTDWNGMAVAALVRAGTVMGEPEWIALARTIFTFVIENLSDGDRLLHTWCSNAARHPAVIDDYANMARAALALYQATGEADDLTHAMRWVEIADTHYWDDAAGGYFLAADDTADLIVRTKTIFDNAVPSGNGVMLEVLARLFLITGKEAYRERADELIAALAPHDPRALMNQPSLAIGYETLAEAHQVVIATDSRGDALAQELFRAAILNAPPDAVISWAYPETALPDNHPAAGKTMIDSKAAAYVCRGPVCSLPIQTPSEIKAAFG